MPENFEQNKLRNAELLEEAQFALQQRTEPNIVLMSASDYGLQRKILARLKAKLPEYQFYDIDLTPFKVVSLHKALQEHLPAQVLNSPPITYCVNVFGLENSRLASADGKIIDSGMIAQLNYEREIVFRKPNYLTILWGDHDFFVQLQRQAPDFWSWVTYYFEFEQEEIYEEVPSQKDSVPTFSAKLPQRDEYIKSLEEKLAHLPLNHPDKSRTTQERINLYYLLAKEYAQYFDYTNSKKHFENAISLCKQIGEGGFIVNELLFNYATSHLTFRNFDEALHNYGKVLENLASQNSFSNFGVVYHQIGMVYQQQRNWEQALENYGLALQWYQDTGQSHEIGGTYHQIGMVYEEQRNWEQALENYGLALQWYQDTGQSHAIGGTYHQIGRVYQQQRNWEQALENYGLALQWKQDTGQSHEIGGTYHQIGMVYEEQRNWEQALENYGLALQWKQDTGQSHEIGGTYHQIGRVYQQQRNWEQALENYGLALQWYQDTGQSHAIGGTYHQIGRVYEEQSQFSKARENFEKSLESLPIFFEKERIIVKESIQRIDDQLSIKV